MDLTPDDIKRISALARLPLTPEEEERFAAELTRIVAYFNQLADVAMTEGPATAAGRSRERPDRFAAPMRRDRFLSNAPEVLDGFLVVPQVLESDDG